LSGGGLSSDLILDVLSCWGELGGLCGWLIWGDVEGLYGWSKFGGLYDWLTWVNLEGYTSGRHGVSLESCMAGYLVVQILAAQSWLAVDPNWIILFHLCHLQL